MATGIVSVALELDGRRVASLVLLWIALAVWIWLAVSAAGRLLLDRDALLAEARRPGSLSGVAAVCVLGTSLTLHGQRLPGEAFLVLAALLFAFLGPRVCAGSGLGGSGSAFLLPVSLFATAVLAASLAAAAHRTWLIVVAIVLAALAVPAYALVFAGFDLRQLLEGRGDHWVAAGAVAIGAVACGEIGMAAGGGALPAIGPAARTAAFCLWALAMALLAPLLAAELLRPRLGFDRRRWATAFPLGMYAAMCFTVGRLDGPGWIVDLANLWTWVALAFWVILAAATAIRAPRALRSAPGQ
jgi:tellurite resistance protein TehA-like permease